MAYASLRDFIDELERTGNLRRISHPVSPDLEMTEIHRRVIAEGGPALLFERPRKADGSIHEIPVLVNLFGTVERVAAAIGRKPDELRGVGETLAFLRQPEPPGGLREAFEMLPLARQVLAMKPKTVRAAPCQQIIWEGHDVDLTRLPIQTCWPGEPAPLITWPLVVTRGPDPKGDRSDNYNLGIYRLQVRDRESVIMRWLAHRGGAQQFARWKAAASPDIRARAFPPPPSSAPTRQQSWQPSPRCRTP